MAYELPAERKRELLKKFQALGLSVVQTALNDHDARLFGPSSDAQRAAERLARRWIDGRLRAKRRWQVFERTLLCISAGAAVIAAAVGITIYLDP